MSAVLSASEHLHVQVNGPCYGREKQLLSSQWLQLLSRGPQSGLRLRRWLIESAPLWRVPTPSQPPYFNGGALNSSFWGIYSPGPIPLQSWRGESHCSLVPTETAAQMHSFRQGGCRTPMRLSVPSLMCVCWHGCRCFCVSVCVCVWIYMSEWVSRWRRARDLEVFSVISLSVLPNHFHVGPQQQQRGGGPHLQRWESSADTHAHMFLWTGLQSPLMHATEGEFFFPLVRLLEICCDW